ncbi:SMI1/KNR4 family protein [Halobaculum sp. MBLA0147]|uniref:SMI1/KNR4 family protein n=1 Tax=Halobaculum sp. MBLA0147 TaxID=3079934 RepID=UPI0035240453
MTVDHYLGRRVVRRLVEAGVAEWDDFAGCSRDEVGDVERTFGVEFPETYRSCLRQFGRESGPLFVGEDVTVDTLPAQREYAEQRLEDWGLDFVFGDTHFVFLGHQGYSFQFFDTSAGDDPPVYSLLPDEEPTRDADSFSTWVLEEADRVVRVETGSTRGFDV